MKDEPHGTVDEGQHLASALAGLRDDKAALADVRLRLVIDGGLPEDRFPLAVSLDGDGRMAASFAAATDRQERAAPTIDKGARAAMKPDELAGLLVAIEPHQLAEAVPPRIPPDSLIGTLEIDAGGRTHRIVFMADPEQAAEAGQKLPPSLQKLVARMVAEGEKTVGKSLNGNNR